MKCVYSGVMNSIGKSENGFTKAMRETFEEYEEVTASGLFNVTSADIVFLQPQDDSVPISALQHLKNIGAWVCNWTGDARGTTPVYCYNYARYVDLACFSNMRDVHNMRSVGYKSDFLQIGADPEIYYPDNSITKDIDICFMANNYGHFPLSGIRKQLVAELKQTYGDRFKAYGIGMPDGNFMSNQKGEADIYRRAKIGINLSHYDYERYTSDRLFRMLNSGVLVLTHEFKGIYEDFNPHDFGIWRNLDELKAHINYYLADDEARTKIAANGHQKALERYTFHHMAENIKQLYLNK